MSPICFSGFHGGVGGMRRPVGLPCPPNSIATNSTVLFDSKILFHQHLSAHRGHFHALESQPLLVYTQYKYQVLRRASAGLYHYLITTNYCYEKKREEVGPKLGVSPDRLISVIFHRIFFSSVQSYLTPCRSASGDGPRKYKAGNISIRQTQNNPYEFVHIFVTPIVKVMDNVIGVFAALINGDFRVNFNWCLRIFG